MSHLTFNVPVDQPIVQTEEDRRRLVAAGVPTGLLGSSLMRVAGNAKPEDMLKFLDNAPDVPPMPSDEIV